MHGKTCLVTGATDGIGKETAKQLAVLGAQVVITGRKPQKTAAAVQEIKEKSGNPLVEALLADFSDQAQTRQLAADFQAQYERLDVLVNNAGIVNMSRREAADGLEMTFAVNHLGYFLLTECLRPKLQAGSPTRIINVSSAAHEGVQLDFDDLQAEKSYSGMKVYGRSKLANLYFTYELARQLAGTNVTVNALHPGFVASNLGADTLPVVGGLLKKVINLFAGDVETGAQTSVYLASSSEVAGVTGKYFVDCQPVASSSVSYDEAAAQQLWQVSEQMVRLNDNGC